MRVTKIKTPGALLATRIMYMSTPLMNDGTTRIVVSQIIYSFKFTASGLIKTNLLVCWVRKGGFCFPVLNLKPTPTMNFFIFVRPRSFLNCYEWNRFFALCVAYSLHTVTVIDLPESEIRIDTIFFRLCNVS